MSLINQMLKDLESRRASGDLSQRAVDGMGAAAREKQKKQGLLLLGLITVIVILASTSGYLLLQDEETEATQSVATAPATEAAKMEIKPVQAGASKAPQATSKQQPSEPTLVKKQTPAYPPVRETPAGMTSPDEALDEEERVREQPVIAERNRAPATIRKRLRPQSNKQLAEQQYQKGYNLLQKGDRKGAEDAWREALRIDASHTASRESLAILYLSQSRRIEAAEQLRMGLASNPGSSKLALLYSRMQLDAEDTQGAVATLEKAMQAQQQSGDFYAFTAAAYQRLGDYEKSIVTYQAALKQQPKQSVWWMGLGISLEGAGKTDDALAAYNEAKKSGLRAPKLRQYVEGRIRELE